MKAVYRANRTRAKIHGTAERPRLSVNFSNLHITAQIIDDDKKVTLAYATTVGKKLSGTKTEKAAVIGKEIAEKARRQRPHRPYRADPQRNALCRGGDLRAALRSADLCADRFGRRR